MSRGPNGERRSADVVGCAVKVAKIATGEIPDNHKSGRVQSGKAGGTARASSLSSKERSAIAQIAAKARWQK